MPIIKAMLDKHVLFHCKFIERLYLIAYISILQPTYHLASFLPQTPSATNFAHAYYPRRSTLGVSQYDFTRASGYMNGYYLCVI